MGNKHPNGGGKGKRGKGGAAPPSSSSSGDSGGSSAPRTKSAIIRSVVPSSRIGAYLKNVPLLSKLKPEQREILGGAMTELSFKDGKVVFNQGDTGNGFYVIKRGDAVVLRTEAGSKDAVELGRLGKGDYFGETALLNNAKRAASVAAVGELEVLFLDKTKFNALFSEDQVAVHFAKRRIAVSAEKMHAAAASVQDAPSNAVRDKSSKLQATLLKAIKDNILFSGLEDKHKTQIVKEMYRSEIKAEQNAIKQGELGNNFFVVESGMFDILIEDEETKDLTAVAQRGPGTCFGELALMYNAPRAATVMASENSVVWIVDRFTFRRIAQNVGEAKLDQYSQFLSNVDLLQPLTKNERAKIAEALEEVNFSPGDCIFKQGQDGDSMYIVRSGEASVVKTNDDGTEEEVATCKPGDFFGERALMENEPRAATISAIDDLCTLRLDRNAFSLLLGPLEDIMKDKVASYEESQFEEEVCVLRDDIKMEDLETLGTLGKGSFGHVTLVKWRKSPDGETFALKAVSKAQIVETGQQGHIMSEKKVMSTMKHPFLVCLHATFKDADRLYFLLDPILGGELFTILRKRRYFSEDTARFYAAHVVDAFQYMHDRDTVYRDLKPENLLLDADGYMKVTDFGFAKKLRGRTWTLCGTPDYLAPEIVGSRGHGKGVDYWTLGVLIYEMLASFPPFYDEDPMKTYAKIMHGKIKYPSHFSKEAVSLVKKLLNRKPTKRLGVVKGGAQLIKEHSWFTGFSFKDLLAHKIQAPIIPKVKGMSDMSNFEDYGDGDEEIRKYEDDGSNWEADF